MRFGQICMSGLIAVAIGLCCPAPVQAANWVYVTTSGDGDVFLYDSTSIRRTGNQVTVWEKQIFGDKKPDGEAYRLSRYRYDCLAETFTLLAGVTYKSDKKVLRSYTPGMRDQTESTVVPETISQIQLNAVCRAGEALR